MSAAKPGLYVFTRDLRLQDNRALNEALRKHHHVIPLFILDQRQGVFNDFFSSKAFSFMIESLEALFGDIAAKGGVLNVIEGLSEEVLESIFMSYNIGGLFCQRDYTPFARRREEKWEQLCRKHHIPFHGIHQSLLHVPGEVLTKAGSPFRIYSPFKRQALACEVPDTEKLVRGSYRKKPLKKSLLLKILREKKTETLNEGGRERGLEKLENFLYSDNYSRFRDYPAQDATSGLSPHVKFGTLSAREIWHEAQRILREAEPFLSELLWRDFFGHIAFHFPRVFSGSFHEKYDSILWDEPGERFLRWCRGETGFPLVDAGMRELLQTGSMHNRVRMVAASFLVKDLHIHWREGERYFARHLKDYDQASNNGNWQWAASTGCDSVPYFRVMSPWLQQKRFDPRGEYVKKWIPELATVDPSLFFLPGKASRASASAYPKPLVDHQKERIEALERYRRIPLI